jgi:spermidine dehydrogenase
MFSDHGFNADRWGHAYVVAPPGFYFGADGEPAPKDIINKRLNRLAFGHSELMGIQLWDHAANEGERAAKQILEVV